MIMVVTGFSRCIRITNSFVVELWCLRDGLIMRCNLNITSIVVELDAKAIVDVFHKPDYKNNVLYSILDDCRQLISRFARFNLCTASTGPTTVLICLLGS